MIDVVLISGKAQAGKDSYDMFIIPDNRYLNEIDVLKKERFDERLYY